MCGIFGVARPSGITESDRLSFERLSAHLVHRGPDGFRSVEGDGLLVGMHRLSIVDPNKGWGPFRDGNGRISVLANGEIYNAAEIAQHSDFASVRLESHSDLAVIPNLYALHGLEYVHRLRGMFAIAIWDDAQKKLVLSRDRMGEKPLFYALVAGAFWFSSEQSALVKSGLVAPTIDQAQINKYLTFGYVPEPDSILEKVRRVPPGHHLQVSLDDGALQLNQYWQPIDLIDSNHVSAVDFEECIRDAVRLTTRSDVPVAVALSGGLDSSLVAALAKEVRGDIHAITVGYRGKGSNNDESDLARSFAEYLDIPCHTAQIQVEDAAANFESMCQRRDEPISDISGLGYDAVARTAKDLNFPVLLTGQGGDELFWGYPWVNRLARRSHDLSERRTRLRVDTVPLNFGQLSSWLDDLGGMRTNHVLAECAAVSSDDLLIPLFRLQPGHHRIERQIARLLPGEGIAGNLRFPAEEISDAWPLFGLGILETYLRTNGLAQIDRLTMSHSIEGRSPLVDYFVVEMALSMMANPEVLTQPPKAPLRKLASHVLPTEIIERPKRGFTPPIREWIREIWWKQTRTLESPILADETRLERTQLLKCLREPILPSGRVSQMSLRLMTLELWLRGLH